MVRHFLGTLDIYVKVFVQNSRLITILLVMLRFVLNFENLCGHAKWRKKKKEAVGFD